MSKQADVQTRPAQETVCTVAPAHAGLLQRTPCECANRDSGLAGGCAGCGKKRAKLAPYVARRPQASSLPPAVREVANSTGQPLDAATRALFEPRFGHDFSRVRVHTDAKAAEAARAVSAMAYTLGHNIVFDSGYYEPHTLRGQRLLAHELTHTIQQRVSPMLLPTIQRRLETETELDPEEDEFEEEEEAEETDETDDAEMEAEESAGSPPANEATIEETLPEEIAPYRISRLADAAEVEAERIAEVVVSGQNVTVGERATQQSLHRQQRRRRRRRRRRRGRAGRRPTCNCWCHTEYGTGAGESRQLRDILRANGVPGTIIRRIENSIQGIAECIWYCARRTPTATSHIPPRAGPGPHGYPFGSCGERRRRRRTQEAYRRPSARPAALRPGGSVTNLADAQPGGQTPTAPAVPATPTPTVRPVANVLTQVLPQVDTQAFRNAVQRWAGNPSGAGGAGSQFYVLMDDGFFTQHIAGPDVMARVGAMGARPTPMMNWNTAGLIGAAAISALAMIAVFTAPLATAGGGAAVGTAVATGEASVGTGAAVGTVTATGEAGATGVAVEGFRTVGQAGVAGYRFLATAAANDTVRQAAAAAGVLMVFTVGMRQAEAADFQVRQVAPATAVPASLVNQRLPQGTRPLGARVYYGGGPQRIIGIINTQ